MEKFYLQFASGKDCTTPVSEIKGKMKFAVEIGTKCNTRLPKADQMLELRSMLRSIDLISCLVYSSMGADDINLQLK